MEAVSRLGRDSSWWAEKGKAPYGRADNLVVPKTLFLSSDTLHKPIEIDLTRPAADLARLKKEPSGYK